MDEKALTVCSNFFWFSVFFHFIRSIIKLFIFNKEGVIKNDTKQNECNLH